MDTPLGSPIARWPAADRALVPDARKICVLRANGVGDLVFALPALRALRETYPDAEITLLALDWHRAFLRERGLIDRVIAVPTAEGIAPGEPDHEAIGRFFEAMRLERFDIALQLHGGGRHSNPFVRSLGARLTAGLQAPEAAPLDRVVPYVYFQHEVLRCLEAVSLIGAVTADIEPRLPVLDSDLAEAETLVPDDGTPLAVIHPGATDGRRRWSTEKFAAVADALTDAGARVLVTGVDADRDVVEGVLAVVQSPALGLAGRLTLGGLVGLLSRAAVVVASDSGPLHLARAVGASTAGIYWCGNMITAMPFTRSRHRVAVSWRLDCPACGADCTKADCRHHDFSFVADVPAEEVTREALDLLNANRGLAATPPRLASAAAEAQGG